MTILILAALDLDLLKSEQLHPTTSRQSQTRLFRLIEQEAIINRMGLIQKGIEYVVQRLEKQLIAAY